MFGSEKYFYEYLINILTVKMNVKFPCRMKIEQQGSLLTNEVLVNEVGRYIFNQKVKLKNLLQKQYIELVINILTNKEVKYTAGIIKLYHQELIRSEGQRLILSLSKCFDSEAFCEIIVEKITPIKDQNNNMPFNRTSALQGDIILKQRNSKNKNQSNLSYEPKIVQSRSQCQFQARQNQNMKGDYQINTRNRFQPLQTTNERYQKQFSRKHLSRQDSSYRNNNELKYSPFFKNQQMIQAEVYKEGYQKIKQKYKKQLEIGKQQKIKRLSIEKVQNNSKLQIMRLKFKIQEQQKIIRDKNAKIKDFQSQIQGLQQQNDNNISLREEIKKRDQIIKLLQDKISQINTNNQEFKLRASQRNLEEMNKVKNLQAIIQKYKLQLLAKNQQIQKIQKQTTQSLHKIELQLMSKRDNLEKQKTTVSNLEKQIQNKNVQFQKIIQNQRNNSKITIIDQKGKIDKFQRQMLVLEEEKKDLIRQIDKLQAMNLKFDYEKKLLSEQLETFKSEYLELQNYKQKYNDLVREQRSVIDVKNQLQKQLEGTIRSKDTNLTQATKHFQEQLEYYKRINRELDQKGKSLTNKVVEIQSQLEISKNQQEKFKISFQSSIKQSVQAKQKQKLLRKTLNNRQQQALTMEKEASLLKQKLKNIEQMYKKQIDKQKEEADNYRIQFQAQSSKANQLAQRNSQLILDLNKIQLKSQFAQQKAVQDGIDLKEKKNQVEMLIKNYQEQISALSQSINPLILTQKQLKTKIKIYEQEALKSSEINQKYKKNIKHLEEKCFNSENVLIAKSAQVQKNIKKAQIIQERLFQTENELKNIKNQFVQISVERNKINNIVQALQQQIRKIEIDINTYVGLIFRMEKKQQQLKDELQTKKDQCTKIDLSFTIFKKQTMKNKDMLFDIIQKYLIAVPLQLNLQSFRKDYDIDLKKTLSERSFSQAFELITNQSKELKQIVSKQMQRIKQVQRQNEGLEEQLASVSAKFYNSENTFKKQIDNLKITIQQIGNEKELQAINYSNMINELKDKINEAQQIEGDLKTHIDDLNYVNNNLKIDYEAFEDYSNKKNMNLKKKNSELQQKMQNQLKAITEYDQKCKTMEIQIKTLQQIIETHKQEKAKLQKIIQQLNYASRNQLLQLEGLKKNKKELTEKIEELQLYLNAKQQMQQKTINQLEEEQKKVSELKQFIHTMMKQKQIAIKNDLELNSSIINLESALFQASKELQSLKQLNESKQKDILAQKQSNKKLNVIIKQVENQRNEQRIKNIKIVQKIKQKQKQVASKQEVIKRMEQKNEKIIQRHKGQMRLIKQQLDQNNNNYTSQLIKDNNQKINALEKQIQKNKTTINSLQTKLVELQVLYSDEKNQNQVLDDLTLNLQKQKQRLMEEISEAQSALNNMANQLKLKQQLLLQYSNSIYTLEQKLQQKSADLTNRLQKTNSDWMAKQEELCEQYQQKVKILQKQKDYFKGTCEEKDRQISKLNSQIRLQQINQAGNKKNYEERIQKLQKQKLSIFSNKNIEISRSMQQNRIMSQNLKTKESEVRRNGHDLQIARKDINNLEQKCKRQDQKIKELNNDYQKEFEELKKKQTSSKQFREMVSVHQWNTERQIKKVIQSFIKNYLELGENKNQQRIVELARYLQKTISEKLAFKLIEK